MSADDRSSSATPPWVIAWLAVLTVGLAYALLRGGPSEAPLSDEAVAVSTSSQTQPKPAPASRTPPSRPAATGSDEAANETPRAQAPTGTSNGSADSPASGKLVIAWRSLTANANFDGCWAKFPAERVGSRVRAKVRVGNDGGLEVLGFEPDARLDAAPAERDALLACFASAVSGVRASDYAGQSATVTLLRIAGR